MEYLAEQLFYSNNRVMTYVLAFRLSYSTWGNKTGAVRFEDLDFVFGMPLRVGPPSSMDDRQRSRALINAWTAFANTG